MTTTQWGRKETIVRPFHSPIYSYGAAFVAFVLTCFFLYLWGSLAVTPLQRFYLPIYVRTGVAGMVRKSDQYRLLTVADIHLHARPATEVDVEEGITPQPDHHTLPLTLSSAARTAGLVFLYRGPNVSYLNLPLHEYLRRFVYDGHIFVRIFLWPLLAGATTLMVLLMFSARKDVERLKQMKYGRLLKGPILMLPECRRPAY
jgi:hypothetical protein